MRCLTDKCKLQGSLIGKHNCKRAIFAKFTAECTCFCLFERTKKLVVGLESPRNGLGSGQALRFTDQRAAVASFGRTGRLAAPSAVPYRPAHDQSVRARMQFNETGPPRFPG